MGNPLFGINISKLIHDNISSGVNDCTLIKVTPGTRTSGQATGGTQPTEEPFAAKGFLDMLSRNRLENTLVQDGDVLILVMGDSIVSAKVPVPGDKITILGTTYNLITVEVDPAQAVYSCVGRSN